MTERRRQPAVTLSTLSAKLDEVLRRLVYVYNLERYNMASITDIEAGIESQSSVITSIETLVSNLVASIAAANSSGDPEAVQRALDAITSNTSRLSALAVANTPAAEAPVTDAPVA